MARELKKKMIFESMSLFSRVLHTHESVLLLQLYPGAKHKGKYVLESYMLTLRMEHYEF